MAGGIIDVALLCLALNVYFEARGEPIEGQIAVAEVTLRRADWWSHRVCEEVFRPSQFEWTSQAFPYVREGKAWTTAQEAAALAWQHTTDYSKGATHFHADYVSPKWARSLCRTVKIGAHIFYKECE